MANDMLLIRKLEVGPGESIVGPDGTPIPAAGGNVPITGGGGGAAFAGGDVKAMGGRGNAAGSDNGGFVLLQGGTAVGAGGGGNLFGGDATSATQLGGLAVVQGGGGNTTGGGGGAIVDGGIGGAASGPGGVAILEGGVGGTPNGFGGGAEVLGRAGTGAGNGGIVLITGGNGGSGGAGGDPGDVSIAGGNGTTGVHNGGTVGIFGGNASGAGTAGSVQAQGGASPAGVGGTVILNGGAGGGGNVGGSILGTGGPGDAAGAGGTVVFRGGVGGATSGTGGNTTVLGGDGGAPNGNSGNILLDAGAAAGAGTNGVANLGTGSAQAVNIGRTSKVTSLLGEVATPQTGLVLVAGVNNNINVTTTGKVYYRVTGPADNFSITGFTGGVDGRLLVIQNASGFKMKISPEDTGSTAANRITSCVDDTLLDNDGTATFIYSAADSRWLLIAFTYCDDSGLSPCNDCAPTGPTGPTGAPQLTIFSSAFTGAIGGGPCNTAGHGAPAVTVDGGKWETNTNNDCRFITLDPPIATRFLTAIPDPSGSGDTGIIEIQQFPVPAFGVNPGAPGGEASTRQDFCICARFTFRSSFYISNTDRALVGIAPSNATWPNMVFFGFSVSANSPNYTLFSQYSTCAGFQFVELALPVFNDGAYHRLKVCRNAGDPLQSNGDGTSYVQFKVQVDDKPELVYDIIVQDTCMIPTIIADGADAQIGGGFQRTDLRMDNYCLEFTGGCTPDGSTA